ncbi:50S ribosomal protein L14e [Candidatus Woesearchaeota archaeon]|nr:50S ribosomal protein L14e [Candidatus Woesearchaeota archaeon]
MTDIGRLYVKIAGREAGRYCTIINTLEKPFVMIDGQVRRKKCNLAHLEPLGKTLDLKKGASHTDVVKAFEKIGITITATKPKAKKGTKPIRLRKQKQPKQQVPEQRPAKASEKKEKPEKKKILAKKKGKKK